jgi:pyruvate, water dikinase
MFSLGQAGSRRAGGAKRLMTEIPIVVYVLDLGGGIDEDQADQSSVPIEAVRCSPMKALWRGLSHPDIRWDAGVIHFDWGEFDRLSPGIIKPYSKQLGSYAIFSSDYLNFHIHFGYHFVVLDTLYTQEAESNYILLRFAGGGGVTQSRMLRVEFLSQVLSREGFKIEQKGDLLDVQLTRCERSRMGDALEMIGRLLGCSRLLDLVLQDRSQVDEMVRRFISGDYDLSPSPQKASGTG